MDDARSRRLTRLLSYALRHAPADFPVRPDRAGWVNLERLLDVFRTRRFWGDLTEAEVLVLVQEQTIFRFEVNAGRIRALYGHSVEGVEPGEFATPPPRLYHATRATFFTSIREKGLAAGRRSYAHLTASPEYALSLKLGYERLGSPGLIIVVDTAVARRSAIPFFKASDVVWTAPYIPPSALFLLLESSDPDGLIVAISENANSIATADDHVASSLSQLEIDNEAE